VRFVEEYRDPHRVAELSKLIHKTTTRPWTIMEVCGGQTHAILKFGIDRLLPPEITLVHGPGCPVCVTPVSVIDAAVEIASRPDVIFCSFGDMLRVPGSNGDLFEARAAGADLTIVYSPLDALAVARSNPERQVVFLAVGFETTAPANALAVFQASREGLDNFSILVSHVLVPPAMEAILSSPGNRIQAFLAPGHVCTVMGWHEYEPLSRRYNVPIVVTGFEPLDILQGIHMCILQLEQGRAEVENQYARAVRPSGNPQARRLINEIFEIVPQRWRGIGEIPSSGLGLRPAWRRFDAAERFRISPAAAASDADSECISGLILQGVRKPSECPAFATRCTPEHPLGATMVSSEGACAAYYRYRSHS